MIGGTPTTKGEERFMEAYSGFPYLPHKTTGAFIKSLREVAPESPHFEVQRLCDVIGDAMWVHVPDSHLRAKLDGNNCGEKRRLDQREPGVGENFGKYKTSRDTKPYLYDEVVSEGKTISKLSITSFPFKEDKVWQGYDEVVAKILTSDALIVDLRENGGGDDSRGIQLASALVGKAVEPDWQATYRRQNPASLTVLKNIFVYSKLRQIEAGKSPDSYLDERIASVEKQIDRAVKGKVAHIRVTNFNSKRLAKTSADLYQGPIFILVDADCGSSCESSMNALKAHPDAKTVGENTAGYYNFGDVGYVLLPHSKILLTVPTMYNRYPGDKIYDKVGFAPDIRVARGEDAMDVALKKLQFAKLSP